MYQVPEDSADFLLTGAAYAVPSLAEFRFDGKPLVYFAPPPEILVSTRLSWQTGSKSQQQYQSHVQHSRIIQTSRSQSSQQATVKESLQVGLFWNQVAKVETSLQSSHSTAPDKSSKTEQSWQQSESKDNQQQSPWDKSIEARDEPLAEQWNKPPEKDSGVSEAFQSVDLYGATRKQAEGYRLPQPPLNFVFRENEYTPSTEPQAWFTFGSIPPNPAIQPRDSKRQSFFVSNRQNDQPIRLPWGFGNKQRDEQYEARYGGETDPEITDKPEPEQPDIRESYLFMNTITTVTLPDRIPVDLRDLTISLDIDSFSWELQASLFGTGSLTQIEPDQNGPKQVEVDINGWKWVFIIERYNSNHRFADEQYTVYGTSRTQLLAAPYAPQRSKSNDADINAKQAIEEELQNTGFTASYPELNDYQTPDWIIPGGSFSYQSQTAMQVIAKLVSTSGSIIIPSRNSDTLNIQPRYPASPWAWDTSTMDSIIPAEMIVSMSASWRPEPEYNAVYISGTNAGVAVNVKRQGTAGDNPAPDILEDWLTETLVNTERGRNELAKGGQQSVITLEIPLTQSGTPPGIIEPGQLVEVQDITGDWRALCLSTSIRASEGKVEQSISLERHY